MISPAPLRGPVGLRDPRHPATFLALVLAAFLVVRFLAVAVHEVLGHGLFALAFGGSFYGVYVSPVTGFALVFVPEASPASHATVALAGIAVDLVVGALIFRYYGRVRTFAGRLFALCGLEAFLVYSFAYLAMGAWAIPGGDPERAMFVLAAPHLRFGFTIVGFAWALIAGVAITRELIALVRPGPDTRREVGYIVLFWFPPLPLAAIPNVVLARLAPVALLAYVAFFAIVAVAIALASRRLLRTRDSVPSLDRAVGRIAPIAAAALLILPTWAFFGATGGTAQNLVLGEPPVEAERTWADVQALNVRANLSVDRDVLLEFRFKGMHTPNSPLEAQVVASFEDRADFPYWTGVARTLAVGALNATAWNVTTEPAIDTEGTAWVGGTLAGNPRVIALAVAAPAEKANLTTVAVNGTRTFVTLTLLEPFRYGRLCCGYLDEVNLTWPSGYGGPEPFRVENVTAAGGDPDLLRGFDARTGLHFARFRMMTAEDAPRFFRLVLEVV